MISKQVVTTYLILLENLTLEFKKLVIPAQSTMVYGIIIKLESNLWKNKLVEILTGKKFLMGKLDITCDDPLWKYKTIVKNKIETY